MMHSCVMIATLRGKTLKCECQGSLVRGAPSSRTLWVLPAEGGKRYRQPLTCTCPTSTATRFQLHTSNAHPGQSTQQDRCRAMNPNLPLCGASPACGHSHVTRPSRPDSLLPAPISKDQPSSSPFTRTRVTQR